ncbi:metallophosphoesterase [Pseudomonas sp. 7P_10.2_Bac1]|uniref:metallophosphoesterase n=1 Tax=Pseudomonas sp. 7P_10.2_Bac1 TaxID=2971614 RepID=UPI0021CA53A6|nr:metallophosphoesterase [Pseudomonas sp. 7P_10.2_Bac1]MCU1725407.1 metallophosphoesterase [Pseudomonas sp. 7P_10.2_Bac1]
MLLLHLSDIHFRKSEIDTVQDPNFHLRNELLRDVGQQRVKLGAVDAVIISGDIAFAAAPEEYEYATNWLAKLCDVAGCDMKSIFVVPGNHDVLRTHADQNLVQLLHSQIKNSPDPLWQISKQLANRDEARLLYGALDNYNQFAGQFFCNLLPPDRTRTSRDLTLNDGSTLRLWGLNTALVSSSQDKQRDMFVDSASFQITREPGVTNLVMAHHHLSWLRQDRELEDHLNDVAPIQIFGHVHTNRIDLYRDHIRLTASATQPERGETAWEPGYNFIRVSVNGENSSRELRIKAHVRVWQTAPGGFIAKRDRGDSDTFELTIPLESWSSPTQPLPLTTVSHPSLASSMTDGAAPSEEEQPAITTMRDVALRFFRLSFSKKSEIAGRLQLLEAEDMTLPDHERFTQVIIRAHERGQLELLKQAVLEAER